ncbi:MAG: STAS/SEC14 domain-containing protein [Desulfarculaceae bacterium]|nr:STAS/SEC14 domain-containing protein [Desulfarculaceae bacterium]MCF8048135.1 STAS/SEC14 domain-containing protein [Desulfarculaceae bacterium]MCF8065865.1 STAS/SEC14 domain-containing protein [Desulfarculaceae bacterium]MCF8098698.1 STAS/SEC14 domain-containing protein [Desulfarculaceae bacterium]MCF8121796.1 STAS/SEC14 domain-containing protein [Desulfarculaceae bacterium]
MFKVLEGSGGNVLGAEISGAYTVQDVEQFEKACEAVIAQGHDKVNILVKLDQMQWSKVEPKAFFKDSKYALGHIKQMRHLAIVGDSKLEEVMVKLDNMIFGREKKELIEKYFDVADMDQAWEFVRS